MTKPSRHRRAWRDKQAYAKLDRDYARSVEKTDRVDAQQSCRELK